MSRCMQRCLVIVMISCCVFPFSGYADDYRSLVDTFYGGLADIMDTYMDQPALCLKEIEDYYQANRITLELVRKKEADFSQKLTSLMTTSPKQSIPEFQQQQEKALEEYGVQPPGLVRYRKLFQKFAVRYPEEGIKIAALMDKVFSGTSSAR